MLKIQNIWNNNLQDTELCATSSKSENYLSYNCLSYVVLGQFINDRNLKILKLEVEAGAIILKSLLWPDSIAS